MALSTRSNILSIAIKNLCDLLALSVDTFHLTNMKNFTSKLEKYKSDNLDIALRRVVSQGRNQLSQIDLTSTRKNFDSLQHQLYTLLKMVYFLGSLESLDMSWFVENLCKV